MKFLFDNWFAVRQTRALNELLRPNHTVEHLRDKFPADSKMEDWVRALRSDGDWVLVTGDHHPMRSVHECGAWRESGLTIFFLTRDWLNITPLQQHSGLLAVLNKIVAHAAQGPALGFTISGRGKIRKLYS
jgi:hypothetical protein